jgi:DNA-binding beta-propeller fold protein YncE
LNRPLALATAPNGNLLVINGLDGYVVEVDPVDGKQLGKKLIDGDQAQSPPGSGDLFGIAINPDGKSFYYVEDDINALMEAR